MHKNEKRVCYLILILFLFGCSSIHNGKYPDNFEELRNVSYSTFVNAPSHKEELPELSEKSTLSDYLAYAALHNPGLEAAFDRWKAALERVPQVKSLPDPRFNYAYFIRKVETRVGPQRQKFGLVQTFPWFGKLSLKGSGAMEAARVEKEKYETAKLKLFYRLKTAYYEYYYLARAIAITEENLSLVKYLEKVARTNYSAGIASYSDVIKAQVEIGKIEDRRSALNDLRDPLVAKLNAVLNRPEKSSLPWPTSIPIEQVSVSDQQLFSWLKEANPELKAKDFLAAKEKVDIDLAKKNYFPDITVGLEWIDTEEALKSGTEGSGKDPVIAMISVNLPIWHDKYSAAKKEARARYSAAQKERHDRESTLIADLKMALYQFRDAERKIILYSDTLIPKTKQSLEVSLQAFKTGAGTFLDIIDTQRMLLEFQLSYERSIANRAERLAELEMLAGKEIPRLSSEESKGQKNE